MIKQFFRPATQLMNQLRFNLKFSLIVLLFMVPLLILAITYYRQVSDSIEHTQNELVGLTVFESLNRHQANLVQLLVEDMAWRSGQTVPAKHKAAIADFQKSLTQFADQAMSESGQGEALKAGVIKANQTLNAQTALVADARSNAADNFNSLVLALNQFNTLYMTVANINGLTNDPQVDSVQLGRLLSEKRLVWLSLITRAYGVTAYAVGEGEVSSGTFDSLSLVADFLIAKTEEIKNLSSIQEGLNPALQSLIKKEVEAMLASVDSMALFIEDQFLVAEEVSLDKAAMDTYFQVELDKYHNGYSVFANALKAELNQRIIDKENELSGVLIIVFISLFIVIYLFVGMSYSISMTTNSLSVVARQLADGDTRVSATVRTKDELAGAIRAFNRMAVKVHDLVESVQIAASGVSDQSESVERLANQTGEAVGNQLNDTQAITGAIAELLEVVNLVSQNTAQVVSSLERTSQQTLSGRDTLAGARRATNELAEEIKSSVEVINNLSEQSESINQVLDVIKSIAEQTNLLALNAAIEAARAGEQGRGFAVVADEVRSLAKRTHLSIEEIQTTIQSLQAGVSNAVEAMTNSDEKAARSIAESAKLELALDQITEAVEEIRSQNSATEQASLQQQSIANKIETSLQSISQISKITEDNVQESVVASKELAQHVSKLESFVANFKT